MFRLGAKSRRQLNECEKGASVFEFAIALPFLFIIIGSTVQFGSALNEYMVLTDAVHQAARLAASSIKLTSNNEISNATLTQTGCPATSPSFSRGSGTSTDIKNHQMIQQRVETLVTDAKTLISTSPICITTGAKDGNSVTPGHRNVYVRASIQLGGFFQAFGTVPLSVEAEAPILQ